MAVKSGGIGDGRGRGMGGGRGQSNRAGAGPGGECVCTGCGHKVPHQQGAPCVSIACPQCGARMVRA